MSNSHPPSSNPPPLPGEQGSQQASVQANQARPNSKKHKPKQRSSLAWLWALLLLIGGAGFLYWQYELAKFRLFGFQPPEMAMARYTPKDVIGDLGGLKVRIPRHYAEYVEYDDDPSWGEKRKGSVPERTFDSKLRSFGIKARFPDMTGQETTELAEDYFENFLNPNNPWLSFTINSGENYPGLGANARNGRAEKLWSGSGYWWENYERLPGKKYDLEVYVLRGLHPRTGKPARDSDNTYDIYIDRDASGHVHTYIQCGKTSVPGGVATCDLEFGLEPEAQVDITVSFRPALLLHWKKIRQSARNLLLSFEVSEGF